MFQWHYIPLWWKLLFQRKSYTNFFQLFSEYMYTNHMHASLHFVRCMTEVNTKICWGFSMQCCIPFRALRSCHPRIGRFKQSHPVSYRCCSDIIEFMPSSFSLLTCRLIGPAVNNHFSELRALKINPSPDAIPWGPQPAFHSTERHHWSPSST